MLLHITGVTMETIMLSKQFEVMLVVKCIFKNGKTKMSNKNNIFIINRADYEML